VNTPVENLAARLPLLRKALTKARRDHTAAPSVQTFTTWAKSLSLASGGGGNGDFNLNRGLYLHPQAGQNFSMGDIVSSLKNAHRNGAFIR
jgi:hypothetical protein